MIIYDLFIYILNFFLAIFNPFDSYQQTNNSDQPYTYQKCKSLDSDLKVLNTLNGKIRGECYSVPVSYSDNTTRTSDVFTWFKVPYAEPPIKENRFKKPVPVTSWSNTLNGTSLPKRCYQALSDSDQMSEDCLYLNIFVNANTYLNKHKKLSPVLVNIDFLLD